VQCTSSYGARTLPGSRSASFQMQRCGKSRMSSRAASMAVVASSGSTTWCNSQHVGTISTSIVTLVEVYTRGSSWLPTIQFSHSHNLLLSPFLGILEHHEYTTSGVGPLFGFVPGTFVVRTCLQPNPKISRLWGWPRSEEGKACWPAPLSAWSPIESPLRV
jgi:hypothetical protein